MPEAGSRHRAHVEPKGFISVQSRGYGSALLRENALASAQSPGDCSLMRCTPYSISVNHTLWKVFGSRGNLALTYNLATRMKGPKVMTGDDKVWNVSITLLEHILRKRQWICRLGRICSRKHGVIRSTCRLVGLPRPLPRRNPRGEEGATQSVHF